MESIKSCLMQSNSTTAGRCVMGRQACSRPKDPKTDLQGRSPARHLPADVANFYRQLTSASPPITFFEPPGGCSSMLPWATFLLHREEGSMDLRQYTPAWCTLPERARLEQPICCPEHLSHLADLLPSKLTQQCTSCPLRHVASHVKAVWQVVVLTHRLPQMLGPSSRPQQNPRRGSPLTQAVSPLAASANCATAQVLGSVILQCHPALAGALLALQCSISWATR